VTDDTRPRRYALVPTHSRPTELRGLVRSLVGQCDSVVVVDNASDPPVNFETDDELARTDIDIHVLRDEEQPPNLSRLWNVALAFIHELEMRDAAVKMTAQPAWDVAILNDDTVLPADWYDYVAGGLREHDVIAASADSYGHIKSPQVKRKPDNGLVTRMCPWAFIIRGECGVEADEKFRWWFGDTDLEWRLRLGGGVLVLPGYIAKNTYANSTTVGELAEQARRDGQTFVAKWGNRPW
jgi:hypothetical protein